MPRRIPFSRLKDMFTSSMAGFNPREAKSSLLNAVEKNPRSSSSLSISRTKAPLSFVSTNFMGPPKFQQFVGFRLQIELPVDFLVGILGKAASQFRVPQKCLNPLGQRVVVDGRNEESAGAVFDQLRNAADD